MAVQDTNNIRKTFFRFPFFCVYGLSSVQLLAAAVGRPWQDWKLVSAHGRACDPVAEILAHPQVFFLTSGGTRSSFPLSSIRK